jgi:hypothetical protein
MRFTGLIDSFEKLNSEHGSASILKERLQLLKDQAAAIEMNVRQVPWNFSSPLRRTQIR